MTDFVLVPGAWLGGWVWERVIPHLEEEGHSAYPVTLTGMGERVHLASPDVGMETAIQDVLNLIKFNDLEEFVIVGHSFAGKVVASVADRAYEKVRKIVYLDAFIPAKSRKPQGDLDPSSEYGPPSPGTFAIPLSEGIVDRIGSDVTGADRNWMMSKATPWPLKLASDPIALSDNFDSLMCAYVFCTLSGDPVDDIIAGKWGKLEGPYRKIETGHWPMITKPKELVEDMLALTS